MRFSTGLPGINLYPPITNDWERSMQPGDYQLVARTADDLGFHSLAIPEHIVIPNDMVGLMGPSWSHAMTAMSFVAGATSRIVVDSSVIVLPYHDPVVFAKAVSTLDVLSGGRVRVSIGVGHAEREFEILRVPFHERGTLTDEYLEAIIELWTSESPKFEGKYVTFDNVAFEPKPVQKPHLPVWIGGDADAALRRAARFASGWYPFLTQPEEFPAKIEYIKSQPTFRGGPFEVCYGLGTSLIGEGHVVLDDPTQQPGMSAGEIVDKLGRFAELGVTMSSVPIPAVADVNAYLDYAQWVIEEIKPKVP